MITHSESGHAMLARVRLELGPELMELLLNAAQAAPPEAREWPPERTFQYVRRRLNFTQGELARKAGLTQSQVSRVESGADCLLSTWRRAYSAMGFELHMLPGAGSTVENLEKSAELGRPAGHWLRQRARPRRFWLDGVMVTRAERRA